MDKKTQSLYGQENKKAHKGLHQPGKHFVITREGFRVGQQAATRDGIEFETLSAAKKSQKAGQAIVRASDGIVVSVK